MLQWESFGCLEFHIFNFFTSIRLRRVNVLFVYYFGLSWDLRWKSSSILKSIPRLKMWKLSTISEKLGQIQKLPKTRQIFSPENSFFNWRLFTFSFPSTIWYQQVQKNEEKVKSVKNSSKVNFALKLNLGPRASVYIQESTSLENSWKRTENTTTKVKPEKLVNYHFWRKIRTLIYLCLHFSLLSTIRKHSVQKYHENSESCQKFVKYEFCEFCPKIHTSNCLYLQSRINKKIRENSERRNSRKNSSKR